MFLLQVTTGPKIMCSSAADEIPIISVAHHPTELCLCVLFAVLEFEDNPVWQGLHALTAVYTARAVSIQREFHGAPAAGEGQIFAVAEGMGVVS